MSENTSKAWDLAMILLARGKIPFDPTNMAASAQILARYLKELEVALQGAGI